MKLIAVLACTCSVVFASGGAAPGSAKAWELEQARKEMASQFDSSALKGPKPSNELQFGKDQVWFADWDLKTDRSPSGPKAKEAFLRGQPRFLGIFNEKGWITELRFLDHRGNVRWSRAFTYKVPEKKAPASTPVTWTADFYDANGDPLERDASVKATRELGHSFAIGARRMDVHDALGDALEIFPQPDGGDLWVYYDGAEELRFRFDKNGSLVESPKASAKATAQAPVTSPTKP